VRARLSSWPHLFLAGAMAACGSGSSTAPSTVAAPSTARPTVTGVWDVALPDENLVLTLTENAGSVSGTLQHAGEAGSIDLAGTISADGQMALGGRSPVDGTQVSIQASVDAARRSFTGSVQLTLPGVSVNLPIRGAKRSDASTGPPPTVPIGEVELLSASVPFGETIPTVRLGTQGQAAPSLTFTLAVRTFEDQTGILAQVWVRTEAVRCMGAGIANLTFAAGERRVFDSFNVSFQQGSDPAPCQLPYTTSSVEITLSRQGQVLVSQRFPGAYSFLAPS
jgi:hypothetical protein